MSIIDELRSYRVGTDLVSWHPVICDRAADYITDLLARAEAAEAENATLRKMQPVRLDDTSAQALALAVEMSELQQKLAAAEARAEKAQKERNEALEAICTHCGDFPCRENNCPWWRGQKED